MVYGLAKVLPNIIGMLGSHNLSCSLCGRNGTSCLVLFGWYWPGWMYRGMGWLGSQRHHVNILWWRWKPCRPQELQTTTGKWRVHSGSEGSLHSQNLCFWNQPVHFSVELSSRARPKDPNLEICWTTSQDRFHKEVPTQGTGATWNYHMPLGWSHLKDVTIRYSWPGLEYPPFSVAVNGYPGRKNWFSTSRCTAGCSGCKALGDHVLVPSFQQTASLRFYLAFWSKCVKQDSWNHQPNLCAAHVQIQGSRCSCVLVPLISIEVLQLHAAVRFVWKCGIPAVYGHWVGNMMINPIHWIFNQVFVLMINPLNMWIWGMPYFAGQTQFAVTTQMATLLGVPPCRNKYTACVWAGAHGSGQTSQVNNFLLSGVLRSFVSISCILHRSTFFLWAIDLWQPPIFFHAEILSTLKTTKSLGYESKPWYPCSSHQNGWWV